MPALDLTLAIAAAQSSAQLSTGKGTKASARDVLSPIAAQTSRRRGVLGAGISVALIQSLITARAQGAVTAASPVRLQPLRDAAE